MQGESGLPESRRTAGRFRASSVDEAIRPPAAAGRAGDHRTRDRAAAADPRRGRPQTFTVSVVVPDPAVPTDTDVVVTITVPQAEASLMDIFGLFQQGDHVAKVTMIQE